MSGPVLTRRQLALGSLALLGASAAGRQAHARSRTSLTGTLSLRVPWPLSSFDPHRIDDGASAIFGRALFDTLYVRDETSTLVPSLAEAEPEPDARTLRVRLRAGLRTARDRPLDARDAAFAIARARRLGAGPWLADVPKPRVDGNALVFAMRDAGRLMRALASPLVAIVPSGFSATAPDGTGPFAMRAHKDGVTLVRNPRSANGPSFLDGVVVREAPDLAASLRAFETGTDDLGWLGSGLHEPRAFARPFDFGPVAYGILFTGHEAMAWDAPGVAQRLCDGIPSARLSHLAIGPGWQADTTQGWGGPNASLIVREDAAWLVELARAVAATVSRPMHEVTVKTVSAAELAQRRASRSFALCVDVVRPLAQDPLGALVALSTADGAGRARDLVVHPPVLHDSSVRSLTRTLRCGVVGEVRVQGARQPEVTLAPAPDGLGFDLGASTKGRPR